MLTLMEKEVQPAFDGGRIYFQVPILNEKFLHYWEKKPERVFEIMQIISETMINQPYKRDPELFFEGKYKNENVKLYHPNHDTTHAARQFVYGHRFIELIEEEGLVEWNQAVKECNGEEKAAFHMATFCLRIGRLNEDKIHKHELRSAELYGFIAMQLGFNSVLIKNIQAAMHLKAPKTNELDRYDGFAGDASLRLYKAKLCTILFKIVHHLDLVRCWNSKENKFLAIKDPIVKELKPLLITNEIEERVTDFLRYACEICLQTGCKVTVKELNVEIPKYNKTLMIASTKNVADMINHLMSIAKPTILKGKIVNKKY